MVIERNKSMREKVYDVLKEMIISGEISSGERIIETEYSEKFNISRTPIREAIRMLELEGLVINNSTGGVIVKEVTEEDILEIYKIRIALEGVVLEEAIKNFDEKYEAEFIKILSETEAVLAKDADKAFVLFSDFNKLLYKVSKLPKVETLVNNLNLYIKRFRRLSIDNPSRKIDAFKEHKEIFLAIKNKDLKKALKINKAHLEKSMSIASKK